MRTSPRSYAPRPCSAHQGPRPTRPAASRAGCPPDELTIETDHLGLTPRERHVLDLLTQGRTNGQIAKELYISTTTASVHVSNILRKLGVTNRVEAAAIAERHSAGPKW